MIFPNFQTPHVAKKFKRIINKIGPNSVTLKIRSDICPGTIPVPRSSQFYRAAPSENCSLRGTDHVAGKYPSIFSRQMEAIIYIGN